MAHRQFVRKMTPSQARPFTWLVYIGNDCSRVEWVTCPIPDEDFVRRLLHLPANVPMLIGRA